MPQYLIDVNLPYYFKLWNNPIYIHQMDINDAASDSDIWEEVVEMNKQNKFVIVYPDRIEGIN